MNRKKITPIQIIGTQRSGSNLLRLMINELDDVIAPHPPHILKTFMPLIDDYSDLSISSNFHQLIDDVCRLVETNPVVWENIVLNRDDIFDLCKEHSLIEIFKAVYDKMAEANCATHWCCKSMVNVKYVDEIEEAGLRPLYIHLVRDGRDVASSFKKVAVGEKHIYHLAKNWRTLQSQSMALVERVGAERAITVRYEDLLREPKETMMMICDFIGLSYTPKVLEYFDSEESKHTAESGFMWENLKKPIIRNNTEKYRKSLAKQEVALFESISGDILQKYNYDLSGDHKPVLIAEAEIMEFDRENSRLKKEILLKDHLKIDLSKRREQEIFINSVKQRLLKIPSN